MTTPTGVHPVADLFPMLADDDLKELAHDIRERGLLQPIVLDAEGRVLDGRNRLAACEMAGVEPTFATFDGDDPDGYALAVNGQRRDMSKSRKAMVAAGSLLVSNMPAALAAKSIGVSQPLMAQAVTVRDHAPDLIDAVIAGATGLDDAYRVARGRKTEADSLENQLAKLRAVDPELADKVVQGDLSLKAAWVEREQREKVEREHATRVSDTFRSIVGRILGTYHTDELRDDVVQHYTDDAGNAMPAEISPDTIRAAGDYLHMIADRWKDARS